MVKSNRGTLVAEQEGIKIFFKKQTPKRKGKCRLWISIRQDKPKEWRVAATLSYVNAIDVRFEK